MSPLAMGLQMTCRQAAGEVLSPPTGAEQSAREDAERRSRLATAYICFFSIVMPVSLSYYDGDMCSVVMFRASLNVKLSVRPPCAEVDRMLQPAEFPWQQFWHGRC